jgi:GDPmannose 4,6-dehydratase
VTTSVRDFVRMAFEEVGIILEFDGEGLHEIARVKACVKDYYVPTGKIVVAVDPNYFRPTEVELLIGDPTKAQTKLGWQPQYTVEDIVKDMVTSDLRLFERDRLLISNGLEIVKNDE